ncbi:hypothetical protein L3X38_002817 [Prunus dulcis]|uniref:Pentatricopeptide repeat superfamily protein n=1 Tax=Prunus dulcis TaxID=3755 RepID=A0AAD4ZLC0_PRUDU|nr:hypothetical protein L3X38_002817 [Prunus dulcis]
METLIQTRCKSGTLESEEALGYFNSMIQTKPIPSNWTFKWLCKNSALSEAVELFRKIEEKGYPDVVTYNTLIYGMCQSGKWEKAKSFLICMVDSRIPPDVYTYGVLISALCKEERIQEAIALFEDMTGKGINPNVFIFNSAAILELLTLVSNPAAAMGVDDFFNPHGDTDFDPEPDPESGSSYDDPDPDPDYDDDDPDPDSDDDDPDPDSDDDPDPDSDDDPEPEFVSDSDPDPDFDSNFSPD